MKSVAVIVGTVPEAVKLGSVCAMLLRRKRFIHTRVILSGQHKDRVPQILKLFGVRAQVNLASQVTRSSLSEMTGALLDALGRTLRQFCPDLAVVQGDTATALAGAQAAFYEGIPVAHVEAGLTTGDIAQPFPEELHRQVISRIASLLFAPSRRAAGHATSIARPGAKVFACGNPCVDAMVQLGNCRRASHPPSGSRATRKRILVTIHRRENHGRSGMKIGKAIARIAATRRDAEVVYVGHSHPALCQITQLLEGSGHTTVLPPQGYLDWLHLLGDCYFVLSDSGGAQEEAPWLHKPVLVLRDETERPEVVELGAAKLVGSEPRAIYESAVQLLDDAAVYRRMRLSRSQYPYGNGTAATQIVSHVWDWLRTK